MEPTISRNWRSTSTGPGTTRPMNCGGDWTTTSGRPPKTHGSFYRRSRETRSMPLWPRPDFRERFRPGSQNTRILSTRPVVSEAPSQSASQRWSAYFSMEFMLSEALPIYSGGLGNVAGDQLKSASDLGVPVVGVGLLYQQGYFRQDIDAEGRQQALYPYQRSRPVAHHSRCASRTASGCGSRSHLPGYRIWRSRLAGAGGPHEALPPRHQRSREPPRAPRHHQRTVRRRSECACKQEMVLGIGGWRLLRELGSTRGLPSQRRPCRVRRPGARPQLTWRNR